MSANDKDEFIRTEIDWIGVALKEKAPFLGICLGAQMLTLHLGAKVGLRPRAARRDRLLPAASRRARAAALGAVPRPRLPVAPRGLRAACRRAAACHIRRRFPNQAFAYGPAAFGVQFHPEITFAQVHRWTGHDTTRLEMKGARERQQHIDGHVAHGPKVQAWLGGFLDRWVGAELSRG